MRVTNAIANAKMQEFCQKLFDKTDPLGYDVSLVNHGETIWQVTIENLHEKDVYIVEYNPQSMHWSWIRVITS